MNKRSIELVVVVVVVGDWWLLDEEHEDEFDDGDKVDRSRRVIQDIHRYCCSMLDEVINDYDYHENYDTKMIKVKTFHGNCGTIEVNWNKMHKIVSRITHQGMSIIKYE